MPQAQYSQQYKTKPLWTQTQGLWKDHFLRGQLEPWKREEFKEAGFLQEQQLENSIFASKNIFA